MQCNSLGRHVLHLLATHNLHVINCTLAQIMFLLIQIKHRPAFAMQRTSARKTNVPSFPSFPEGEEIILEYFFVIRTLNRLESIQIQTHLSPGNQSFSIELLG